MAPQRPTVWVVQDDPRKNMLPARAYGEMVPIFNDGEQITISSAAALRRVLYDMQSWRPGDFILANGDPAMIAVVCAVVAHLNNGRLKILKWDRQERTYYPVDIDLPAAIATLQ